MAKKKVVSVDAETKSRAKKIVRGLKKTYPDVECALHFKTPFQLLVATILSAQCTDERVNKTTPALFKKFPDAPSMAKSTQPAVEKLVKSTGFFRNKASNIRKMAQAVVKEHGGEIPQTLEQLVALPGVGRKTGNVILGVVWRIPSGVVVDTHVKRICNLLGLTTSKNPEIIERDLMEILHKKDWIDFSHQLIHHGRQICVARRPNCEECSLLKNCPRVGLSAL